MLMAIVKDVWKYRDNHFGLIFEATDPEGTRAPVDSSKVTRLEMELEGSITIAVDANTPDAPVDWWSPELLLAPGEFRFTLGDAVANVTAGAYAARVVLFSLAEPGGIVWTSWARQELLLSVHDASPAQVQSAEARGRNRFWGMLASK
jgi:hypothetical protein